jgi:hypothetical protein
LHRHEKMVTKGVEAAILKFLAESDRPVTTREISGKLKIAWHTADRHCLKMKFKQQIDCFTIGKSTAWFPKK